MVDATAIPVTRRENSHFALTALDGRHVLCHSFRSAGMPCCKNTPATMADTDPAMTLSSNELSMALPLGVLFVVRDNSISHLEVPPNMMRGLA